MNLYEADFNKPVMIKNINLHGMKKRRLYDLGFINGEKIVKEFESIFKNPICYQVKNTLIAVRNEDAMSIEVEYEK